MNKKYVVRLSAEERAICQDIVKHLKGSSQKFRRAQILLQADADGPHWPDVQIAEDARCRVQTTREHSQKAGHGRLSTGFGGQETSRTAHALQARWSRRSGN